MKSALEGLKGVTKVGMDLKQDLFRVTLAETDPPTKEDLFKAIRELSYTPSLADASTFGSAAEPVHPAAAEVPHLIQKALDRAKAESKKFVLVDCMGDN